MKAALCVLLLATALVYGAEEKKNEKRGVLGLGYGFGHAAPLVGGGYYGQGLGLYNPSAGLGYGHGVGLGYGHGLGLGHGYYGHGIASAPLVSHGVYSAAPVHYGAPLLGLGHGYGLGHGFGLGHGYLH